jgi:RNA polymerase sigma-70 factor, ECF subfamily
MEPATDAMMAPVQRLGSETELADFESLVRRNWPSILRFVMASVRDRDAAESITQDCFWRVHQSRDRFRGDCSVRTWLMQIAVNLVRDHARNRRLQFWKRAQDSWMPLDSAAEWLPSRDLSPEARFAAAEQVRAVWRATERLSERQRTVFLLRFVEDMELLEIASATGMKEGTVKVHLFRAIRAVREEMRGRI